MNTHTVALIASAYILPIFDYCNFIFHVYISILQTLQNSIVRCIYQINKFSHTHIKQFLGKLHWLPIKSSCIYKIALLAHKALYHHIPDYLSWISSPLTPIKLERSTPQEPFYLQLHNTNLGSWSIAAPYSFQSPYELTLPPNHSKKTKKHTSFF